ncbi:ABC transporter substrate-binding protein [Paraburkholderia sp. ZP32-5]|uniref:ABC transporter substrate-binding protein n=1 Tax=Paraburkholderia sp. ZP32-5 TaxID=2883245 RepID=UPI001F3AD012|nr:ABC transporter substrate-binding protein [Paraburkholderia sp. ZP32-5]
MPNNRCRQRTASMLVALAACTAFACAALPANAQTYGNCAVTGKKGSMPLKPAIPGQLTVEVSLPAPGWWNGDTPESMKDGYEYCMAANIAWRAGLDKVVVRNVSWDALIAGQTKDYDLALSEASITPERAKVVDFSTPYFDSDIGALVKTSNPVTASNIRTMRIGVHQGTTGETFASNVLKPSTPVKVFPDTSGMFTALAANQIDVVLTDTAYSLGQAANSHGTMKVVGQYSTGEKYGAIYPKGSSNEANLNKIIQAMTDDGTLKMLAQKYLAAAWGQDPTKVPYFKP